MVEEEFHIVQLQDRFYRDGFNKVIFVLLGYLLAITLLILTALYIYLSLPKPIAFLVDADWHVQPPVSLSQPYLTDSDLLQWTSDVLQRIFVFDYYHYEQQLQAATKYFTQNGWRAYSAQVNSFANKNNLQVNRLFTTTAPLSAPIIKDRGFVSGRYGWWVEMPLSISYAGFKRADSQSFTLNVLVVRVPTMNNLIGVGIENMIVSKKTSLTPITTG